MKTKITSKSLTLAQLQSLRDSSDQPSMVRDCDTARQWLISRDLYKSETHATRLICGLHKPPNRCNAAERIARHLRESVALTEEILAEVIAEERAELWLCDECTIAAVNDDYTALDFSYGDKADERMQVIKSGLESLGWLSANFDSETGEGIREFSGCGCDCCKSTLAGEMHRFAVLSTAVAS